MTHTILLVDDDPFGVICIPDVEDDLDALIQEINKEVKRRASCKIPLSTKFLYRHSGML
ncbi:MAG: hypothetical protein ABSG91_24695 [Syntrophobacteraceae bacterium]|jgi:hypothetical protein